MEGIVLIVIGVLMGIWMFSWIKKIPADPPHVALVTILEQRVGKLKREGLRIFWGYPIMSFILINVTKVNQDLPPQIVRTPDLAELEIPVSVTWTPAWKVKEVVVKKVNGKEEEKEIERESPELLREFLNSGGERGIRTILEDIIRERLREWAISAIEGPQTFEEAMAAREEAVAILLKAILGKELERVPSDEIPTPILLKYFRVKEGGKGLTEEEQKEWDEKWKKIYDGYSEEQKEEIKEAVRKRKEEIKKARQGNGWFVQRQLGIVLNRLNVGEIKPTKGSRLEKVLEARVAEDKERVAEELELNHVRDRIAELKKLGFSSEQALEVVQTERGKVAKTISESKWNISPETRQMIEKIAPEVLARILGGGKK